MNRDKIAEPLEKGILRAMHSIYIFKDGTSRFDATDQPLTHFYPKEMGVSVGEAQGARIRQGRERERARRATSSWSS